MGRNRGAMRQVSTGLMMHREKHYSTVWTMSSGSCKRGARIHTSCAVVVAPTLDLAFARWCFTVECDIPRRWAAAYSDPAT
jgi:hypothetical protein